MNMKQEKIINIPEIRILGRIASRTQPQPLFWAASGLEFNFTGSELWLDIFAEYETINPWLCIEINNSWVARTPLESGSQKINILKNFSCGPVKHIRIFKDTQPMYDDFKHMVCVEGFQWKNGTFLPIPPACHHIEFIGDSITSGEGLLGSTSECDWSSAFFSTMNCYARLTADIFKAEFRTISQSGWGILHGWDNNPIHNIPSIYTTVCAPARGEFAKSLGASQAYDFGSWTSDIVVINLGTNDHTAFSTPAWIDPSDGKKYKFSYDQNGNYSITDHKLLESSIINYLKCVRKHNPTSVIIWCYGMLKGEMAPLIRRSINLYYAETLDEKVHFLSLECATPSTIGSLGHPGAKCHRKAAELLSNYIANLCGWEPIQ